MAYKIQLRRGLKKDLPTFDNGEVGYAQDTDELFIGTTTGNKRLTFDSSKYTYAALPVGVEGDVAYCTNGRKIGEGAGAGTGVPIYYSSGWRRYSDDTIVTV